MLFAPWLLSASPSSLTLSSTTIFVNEANSWSEGALNSDDTYCREADRFRWGVGNENEVFWSSGNFVSDLGCEMVDLLRRLKFLKPAKDLNGLPALIRLSCLAV